MNWQFRSKKILLNLVLLLSFFHPYAQTTEEIQRAYPNDDAVILNYQKNTRIFLQDGQPRAETSVSREILILTDKANGLYNRYSVYHGSFDSLKSLEAYTMVPDGRGYHKIKVTQINTEKAESEGVFYDDLKKSSFDFPALTKGSIASVQYTEENTDLHLLSPFYTISYLPVVHEKFTLSFPADMVLHYIIKNDPDHSIMVKEDLRGREHGVTFSLSNVKSMEQFPDAPSEAYYEPHILVQLVSYQNETGQNIDFLKDIDDLYSWDYHFIKTLDTARDGSLQNLTDSLTAGISSQEAKARKIYQWVQHNIKYVAFEDGLEGFIPRRPAAICNNRFGDCKDMASLLTAMMRLAGIPAYFTWIGTRDIPYDYTDVALPIDDNHMISTIHIGDKWIFLDGTDPNCIFGFPSGFIQGKQALIALSEKQYKILRVPAVESDQNRVSDSTFIALSGNGITGNSSVDYQGYFGSDLLSTLAYKDAADIRDYVKFRMSKASNKFILGNYSITHLNEDQKLINIKADFQIPDYGNKISDQIFINMNLEKFYTGSAVIDTAKRKIALENDYKYEINQYTILQVPKEYSVKYIPKDFSYKNALFNFSIHYRQEPDRVIAEQHIQNNYLMLEPKDFSAWNNALKQLILQYKEQVVLQKNAP